MYSPQKGVVEKRKKKLNYAKFHFFALFLQRIETTATSFLLNYKKEKHPKGAFL
jgi:hypothetical protein